MALRKPVASEVAGQSSGGDRNGDEWVLYPTLMEYLTEERWEDGSARLTATLLVFVEQGTWKGCLNDRANDRNSFLAAGSLAGLLVVIEEALKAEAVHWKPKGGKPKRR